MSHTQSGRPWLTIRHLRPSMLAVIMIGSASMGVAQTPRPAVEAPRPLLSAAKQALVREHIVSAKQPVADIGQVNVGATVPPNVDLFALPEDTVTEVPKITGFKFVVAPNGIAVVDPETRQVVQIIPAKP